MSALEIQLCLFLGFFILSFALLLGCKLQVRISGEGVELRWERKKEG